MTISEEQIEAFQKLYQVNARPIQPTNGRTVELHR
jgi:carbonic anhydrase